MDPPLPPNEAARLDALRRYDVLDSSEENAFDDIGRLAARFCSTPIALVSFVDQDRQWFKSRCGLSVSETPRNISFCAYAIHQNDVFIIPDTNADPRFASNPLVIGPPYLRFYAGAALVTPDNYVLGTLCVLDTVPRTLSVEQIDALRTLSRQVMAQLEVRYAAKIQAAAFADLGYRLSAAGASLEAARIIVEAARSVLGWDACSLDIYSSESDAVFPVLTMDTINGACVEVPHAYTGTAPSPIFRRTLTEGGLLLLRDQETGAGIDTEMMSFGNESRLSASLLFVPVRSGLKNVGVLSIQSYTPNAYNAGDLITLQGLADHCGGAFERIHIQETLRVREDEERRAREKLTALLQLGNELSRSATLDELCRSAVELGRSRLGFDRLGIWFTTDKPDHARGSFGVDENGQLRDERENVISTEFEAEIELMISLQKPYLYKDAGSIFNDKGEAVGHGFRAMAPLWDGEQAIGYISTDNLLRHEPITHRDCELLTLYASTLGHLCSRIRAENQVREAKRFADSALDSLPGVFYFYDEAGRFLRWNRNFETVTGYSAEEIAGMHPLDFFAGTEKELVAARIKKVFAAGTATVEAEFVSKDGRKTPYFFTGRRILMKPAIENIMKGERTTGLDREGNGEPISEEENTAYLVGTGIDISERKRLEQDLLQAQKMESIGRLAGGIAHDFNNLLTAILGYAELTNEELTEAHPAQPYIQNISSAAERAAALTRQLLAFARKQMIAPRLMSLNDLVIETSAILHPLLGESIELSVNPRPGLWLVKADFSQLSQVLINLAVNARDAMPGGGKLTIETSNTPLGTGMTHADVAPGDYVMLAVSDTGVGMDAVTQQHIFEPFFTTKEVGRGTGLGLATCYGIIKQTGGHIWLYSEPGHGTTFKIYLPRAEEISRPVMSPENDALPPGTGVIFLVEDEPLVRGIGAKTLRMQGYTVVEAGSGVEALPLIRDYPGSIDLLITDVMMPQMGGRELAEKAAEIRPDTRVLFTSGYTDDTVVQQGILEAGLAFLQKPFSPASLLRKVQEILNTPKTV